MKAKSAFRYRICGTPVRTGCITCKIRRVKCGEEKPYCKRCTSTGRKCDGYLQIPNAKYSEGSSPRKSMSHAPTDNPYEVETLSFFHTFTAGKLSVNFSSDFWRRTIIHAGNSEPSVRHGLIALGAIHRDFLDTHQNNRAGYNSLMRSFAVQQYTKAISHLQKLMASSEQRVHTTLISCILFICFDSFLGNHAAAIMHLKAGLQILENNKGQDIHVSSPALITKQQLGSILLGLGVQINSFTSAQQLEDPTLLSTMLKQADPSLVMTEFYSLDEAREALDSLAVGVGVGRVERAHIPETYNSPRERNQTSLSQWTESMDRFLANHAIRGPLPAPLGSIKYRATLLLIHFLIVSICASTAHRIEQQFEKVLTLCGSIFDAHNIQNAAADDMVLSADIGLIAPLLFTATKAPRIAMRRKALSFLSNIRGQEGMWNSADAVRIATAALNAPEQCENPGTADLKSLAG